MQDDDQNSPGSVIQPQSAEKVALAKQEEPATTQAAPATPAKTLTEPEIPAETASESPWKYDDSNPSSGAQATTSQIKPVQWTASEFIEHSKSFGWYAALGTGAAVLAVAIWAITKDTISAGVVILVAIVFGILASRKPRELEYKVDESGVQIGEKSYPYETFKSFSVVQENAVQSIWFIPLKRFMPILTIYFDPNDEKQIAEVLAAYLPVENHQPDPVDKLMHKIRF